MTQYTLEFCQSPECTLEFRTPQDSAIKGMNGHYKEFWISINCRYYYDIRIFILSDTPVSSVSDNRPSDSMKNTLPYIHGRSDSESTRLHSQASGLGFLLHEDVRYPPGCRVLEAGCGVGAQTVLLARNSPGANFVSIDISPESLDRARKHVSGEGLPHVSFCQADIGHLPFPDGTFDHVFVCFTLEHIPDPLPALENLRKVLKPGGTLTVIEGDHGSALFHPDTRAAHLVIDCLVTLQREAGGNALIGRELEHLAIDAGFIDVRVSPLQTYASPGIPGSTDAVRRIFIAMIEGVREQAIAGGLVDTELWNEGIRDLYRTTEQNGMFCYTFFKVVGRKRGK
jgi:SAM-dependent methyltransferase